jgi:hypothetical protein
VANKRGRPPLKPGWAELVFMHIPTSHDTRWATANELMAQTGLRYMQVTAAIEYLRDNFPEFPLVSCKKGYRFSVDPREVRAFAAWRAKTAMTILRHSYRGAVAPYLKNMPQSPIVPVVRKQFERALEDLGELITATP